MKTHYKFKLYILFIPFILIYPYTSKAQSCEQDLTYCCDILQDVVNVTHFNKDTNNGEIIKWWKRKWIHGRPLGLIKVNYHLDKLVPDIKDNNYETYILPGDKNISVILQVPISKLGENPPYECYSNESILKSSENNSGLMIDLNPYCSETYGPDEVNITLYWISLKDKPIIEIDTNGPACVPAMLYIFNETKKSYELAAEKCGG